jgi:hypothetical protein
MVSKLFFNQECFSGSFSGSITKLLSCQHCVSGLLFPQPFFASLAGSLGENGRSVNTGTNGVVKAL